MITGNILVWIIFIICFVLCQAIFVAGLTKVNVVTRFFLGSIFFAAMIIVLWFLQNS